LLSIDLDGFNKAGGLRQLRLTYTGVQSVLSLADPKRV
jgi:hypothetical protein